MVHSLVDVNAIAKVRQVTECRVSYPKSSVRTHAVPRGTKVRLSPKWYAKHPPIVCII